jgi:hypothetical protein
MVDIIKKSSFVIVIALLLLGCDAFDKQLYLYVPGEIDEANPTTGSVTVAHSVPTHTEPINLSIQLSVSGDGKGRITLDPSGLVILEGESSATFTITAFDDNDPGDYTATITANAAGYTSDSVNITIISDE